MVRLNLMFPAGRAGSIRGMSSFFWGGAGQIPCLERAEIFSKGQNHAQKLKTKKSFCLTKKKSFLRHVLRKHTRLDLASAPYSPIKLTI